LMAQGLLLREQGYACDHGMLYFVKSRTRVRIEFTAELEERTRTLLDAAHRAVSLTVIPDPLEDSPKCNGCSLAGIFMPDETLALRDIARLRGEPANASTVPLKPRAHVGDEDQTQI